MSPLLSTLVLIAQLVERHSVKVMVLRSIRSESAKTIWFLELQIGVAARLSIAISDGFDLRRNRLMFSD